MKLSDRIRTTDEFLEYDEAHNCWEFRRVAIATEVRKLEEEVSQLTNHLVDMNEANIRQVARNRKLEAVVEIGKKLDWTLEDNDLAVSPFLDALADLEDEDAD